MDALAALNAINAGEMPDLCREGQQHKNEAGLALLSVACRQLSHAVGRRHHSGQKSFLDMLLTHGLDVCD
jgi:hypothetical protein